MKSRVKTLNTMIDEEVKKQVKQARSDIYEDVANDIVSQTIACVLYYLDKTYGFRKKRLRSVVEGTQSIMSTKVLGKGFDSVDVIGYMKDTYNIDLENINIIFEDEDSRRR